MAAGTSWDKDAINTAADAIAKLVHDNQDTFDALKNAWPNAGTFHTAQWVERKVDDRRNAIVEHAARLDTIFKDMGDTLKQAATKFQNTDQANADALTSLGTLKDTIDGQIYDMDVNTENAQHNFSDGNKPPAVNDGDGDGYDDNLNDTNIHTNENPDKPTYHIDTPAPQKGPNGKPTSGPPPTMPTWQDVQQTQINNTNNNGTQSGDPNINDATDKHIAQAMGYDVDPTNDDALTADEQAAVTQWRNNHNIPGGGGDYAWGTGPGSATPGDPPPASSAPSAPSAPSDSGGPITSTVTTY